jgi:hypothetical protein
MVENTEFDPVAPLFAVPAGCPIETPPEPPAPIVTV